MRKRTSKILSIVLASAMVLSMHSMAFAEEAQQNEITYADGVTVIKNATDPVSWNGANWAEMDAILGHVETDHLANDKKLTVSQDNGSASYNVIPLEGAAGSYLIFGYGADRTINVEGEGRIPATDYDGRKKVFKGGSAAKDDAFYGRLALVKYDASAKTVTKVDGVELTDFKMDKNNVHATVSGSATVPPKDEYGWGPWSYKKLDGKTTPTFTLKAKVSGKNIDSTVKKAIGTALKKATFTYEILPLRVQIWGSNVTDQSGIISENNVYYYSEIYSNIDASNLNKGAKATLSYTDYFSTKKGEKAVVKKINPKDYTLKTETVAGESIVILDSFNNTDYEYAKNYYNSDEFASEGYKLCFREKGEKKNKTVTKGIYKSNKDVFVTSVD